MIFCQYFPDAKKISMFPLHSGDKCITSDQKDDFLKKIDENTILFPKVYDNLYLDMMKSLDYRESKSDDSRYRRFTVDEKFNIEAIGKIMKDGFDRVFETKDAEEKSYRSPKYTYRISYKRMNDKALEHIVSDDEMAILGTICGFAMTRYQDLHWRNDKLNSAICNRKQVDIKGYFEALAKYLKVRDRSVDLLRGDVIVHIDNRPYECLNFYDGTYIIPSPISTNDSVPASFLTITEFPMNYWVNSVRGNTQWIDPFKLDVLEILNPLVRLPDGDDETYNMFEYKGQLLHFDNDDEIFDEGEYQAVKIRNPFNLEGFTYLLLRSEDITTNEDVYKTFLRIRAVNILLIKDKIVSFLVSFDNDHNLSDKEFNKIKRERTKVIMESNVIPKDLLFMIANYDL